jgi:hypothetical protein
MMKDEPKYYEPREVFDSAIICVNDENRVEYDFEKLRAILRAEYVKTISQLTKYRSASTAEIERRADRLACKWLIAMNDAAIYGSYDTRPKIIR